MLREEQIDLRRRRAAEGQFRIQNLGRNRVFSDYRVVNAATGGQYRVSIRGFDVGDNTCECPDFRTNTLGTCKHIEAVLASLRDQTPPQLRRRKAAVTHPEIYLHYGEQLRIGLHLPPRCSDPLRALAEAFFDPRGLWKGGDAYPKLIELVENVPEQVTIFSDAMEFMEREIERQEMAQRERDWLAQLEAGETPAILRELVRVPLYPYQMRGALFLACRGRAILGDDMGLGKTVQTLAAVEILARERGIERVLVVAPASVKYQWETEIRKFTGRAVQVIDGTASERRSLYRQPTFYRLINYEIAVRDLDELNAWQPDLIVLDLLLPDRSGLEVCREVYRRYPPAAVPGIIMLTALGEETDRIVGLRLGADDYLTKPFSPQELVARAAAVLRRRGLRDRAWSEGGPTTVVQGRLRIEPDKRRVLVGDNPVPLTSTQFTILLELARRPGVVLSRDQLLTAVWGEAAFGDRRTIDVHVMHIRQKLEPFGLDRCIQTVRGIGYRFEDEASSA